MVNPSPERETRKQRPKGLSTGFPRSPRRRERKTGERPEKTKIRNAVRVHHRKRTNRTRRSLEDANPARTLNNPIPPRFHPNFDDLEIQLLSENSPKALKQNSQSRSAAPPPEVTELADHRRIRWGLQPSLRPVALRAPALSEGWRMPRNPGSTDDRRRRSIKCSARYWASTHESPAALVGMVSAAFRVKRFHRCLDLAA